MKPELFEAALRICGNVDTYREHLRCPRAVQVVEHKYAVATDGQALLAIANEPALSCEAEPITTHGPAVVGMLVARYSEQAAAHLPALISWVGDIPDCDDCHNTREEKCDQCGGHGTVRWHRTAPLVDCDDCDGGGFVECPNCCRVEHVRFYGQDFDARVLRRALPRLDETVRVDYSGEWTKPIRIVGDGWTVVVMGMRDGSCPAGVREWPVTVTEEGKAP